MQRFWPTIRHGVVRSQYEFLIFGYLHPGGRAVVAQRFSFMMRWQDILDGGWLFRIARVMDVLGTVVVVVVWEVLDWGCSGT